MRTFPKYPALIDELWSLGSVELKDIIASWPTLNHDQCDRLRRYLEDELGPQGMLSPGHSREIGFPLATERRQARALLNRLEAEACPYCAPDEPCARCL